MKSYINQFKLIFFLSWIFLYLIFPAWALPISVTARTSVFFGLIIFFLISATIINRWVNVLPVNKPFIILPKDIVAHIKNNLWLFVICCVGAALHIYSITLPILIMGDETLHLQGGLLIYDYIDSRWHRIFQIAFWTFIVLVWLILKVKKTGVSIFSKSDGFSGETAKNWWRFVFLVIFFLTAYFFLLRNIHYELSLIRYPPVSKILYFLAYSAFGVNHIFPRIIQLIFHILCAVYLYRTINLFYEKETALLGASIYLFLPIVFAYAILGETANGLNFLIILISYYFIRFIQYGDNRDLLLTSYLIGIGYLYKDPISLMFIICFTFLIAHRLRKNNLHSIVQLKVLSLSLVSIVPWMIISKTFNWRNFTFVLSNLTSLDGKLINYFVLMSSNLSGIIFTLFILSFFYICIFKRNMLTFYFGSLFIVYYFFTVSDMAPIDPRFTIPLYPTIAVFLAVFISRIIQNIKWRHAFKLCFIIITAYLIIICTVPPLNNRFLSLMNKKLHYYPIEEAMKWVKENVKDGERILTIRILPFDFYRVKYEIDKKKIVDLTYEIDEVSTLDKLKAFYRNHNISYIMFPYGQPYSDGRLTPYYLIIRYLKENRDNEFIEIAKFNMDENFIYIYKLKEN